MLSILEFLDFSGSSCSEQACLWPQQETPGRIQWWEWGFLSWFSREWELILFHFGSVPVLHSLLWKMPTLSLDWSEGLIHEAACFSESLIHKNFSSPSSDSDSSVCSEAGHGGGMMYIQLPQYSAANICSLPLHSLRIVDSFSLKWPEFTLLFPASLFCGHWAPPYPSGNKDMMALYRVMWCFWDILDKDERPMLLLFAHWDRFQACLCMVGSI